MKVDLFKEKEDMPSAQIQRNDTASEFYDEYLNITSERTRLRTNL